MKPFGKLKVEWDSRKATSNMRKHGVSFHEAETVLDDPLSIISADRDHSMGEARYRALGRSLERRTLVIICADSGPTIRVLSARLATAWERRVHEQGGAVR